MEPTAAFNAGIPALGTWVLDAFLVTAALAFGLSVAAAADVRGAAPRYLRAARLAALGTCTLIAFDVLLLLYAFVTHDFPFATRRSTATARCRRRTCSPRCGAA